MLYRSIIDYFIYSLLCLGSIMGKKIIFDTDPGIDDAFALLYALNHPSLEVIGITTVYGNVPVKLATNNALI